MKQQPIDKETSKYNAVSSIADLLRETTQRYLEMQENGDILPAHANMIFTKQEHETVKRAFLRLVSEI